MRTTYETITPAAAHREMKYNPNLLIWDVREADEYAEGHIPNAVSVPLGTVEITAEEALPDKRVRLLVYCASGRRSALAAKLLADVGYTNVANFGGIADWPYEIVK